VAYVFAYLFAVGLPGNGFQIVSKPVDGGRHWTKAQPIFPATDLCTGFEPSIGRCVEDGIGGPATTSGRPRVWTSPTAPRPARTPRTGSSTRGPMAVTASTTST
jgi:hypothetical protein